MKTTRLLVSFMLLWAAFACQDSSTDPMEKDDKLARTQNEGLEGKWKMTEYLADPGDGSGQWQVVKDPMAHTIEFKADGKFIETKGEGTSSVPLFDAYKILDEQRIEMIPINKSEKSHIWYYSNTASDKLTLSYGCIEACSGKYVAVK